METTKPTPKFPYYFRKAGRCIKVISEKETITIVLPNESLMPERYSTTYPSVERLRAHLSHFDQTTEQIFIDFQNTFYAQVSDERMKELAKKEKADKEHWSDKAKQNHLAE
jgi:hypothetical protein